MTRRAAYTDLVKTGQQRPDIVQGQVVYKGFQCPTGDCEHWFAIRADELAGEYSFSCPHCGQTYGKGDAVKLFDYALTRRADSSVIEAGTFEMYIDEYVEDAILLKYCLYCYELKPLSAFGSHAVLASGRQGECRRCKTRYNSIKNQSRTADQHRDASQKRRLLVELGGTDRFDSAVVRDRFDHKCFKCGRDVAEVGAAFDHTLPVRYLWPMTTENATLLCPDHNGQKGAAWPGEFYSDAELRLLSLKTGISYDLLRGAPHINPEAIERLRDGAFVDNLFMKYAHYENDLVLIRNRILDLEGFDFLESSTNISQAWKDKANAVRPVQSATTSE